MNTNKINWSAEVATALSAMKDETQKAYTYLKQEAPEVGAEYVRWRMAESGIWFLGFTLGVVAMVHISKRLMKYNDGREAFAGFSIIAAVLFAAAAVNFAADFTKCIVAPRIVLIGGIKEIVK